MRKKLFLSFVSITVFALAVVGMSAFEAQVINVTATIENSVAVDTNHIDYGTVYPQEERDEIFRMELSQSFREQDRVDTVDYIIRQKPKCWSESLEEYGLVSEDDDENFFCKNGGDFEILPLLCPYLSKHEITDDGDAENDSAGINAFHGPISGWDMDDTLATEVKGQLINNMDIFDEWNIDLRVPCFEGSCAQDWNDFVLANNPDAIPADYILPGENHFMQMGCDLWVEVNGISTDDQSDPACSPEICDDQSDNDCDSDIDCADSDCNTDPACAATTQCSDNDGDGYGLNNGPDCLYSGKDCDDSEFNANPGADEVCDDGIDNDCDSAVDCQDSDCASDTACDPDPSCTDGDGDTFNIEGDICGLIDCDDNDGQVYPGVAELCNGIDDNCNGNIDEDWPDLGNSCSVGEGECEVSGTLICNSGNPGGIAICSATPGSPATEVCDDGLDNDCDTLVDCDDDDCDDNGACTSAQSGDVLINEVAWMGTFNSTADEWIELLNTTGSSIDLTNWTLNATDNTPSITLTGTIAANSYFLLERTDDTTVPDIAADQIYAGLLGNASDDLVLRTAESTVIDSADGSSGWPAGDNDSKRTMERCDDFDWHTSQVIEGSPRAANSACVATVNFSDLGADPQYGYLHSYAGASASFTYDFVSDGTVSGTISGTGLKPYATYQLKFEGTPACAGGDDAANEVIGYLGRWWSNDTSGNVNDAYYEANKTTDCITGYLVWAHVTADASGNFSKAVETGASYHVLWCDATKSCGDSNSNDSLGTPDSAHAAIKFCDAANVYGQMERACGGQTFDPGDYDLKMILNEESFHQGPGTWTAAMETEVDFVIY